MATKNNKGVIMYGGILNARSLAIGDKAQINETPSAAEIVSLLQQFRAELQRNNAIPEETRQALEELATSAEKEAGKEKPNRTLGKITAEGLKEATSTIAEIAPTLLTIASQVAVWFSAL